MRIINKKDNWIVFKSTFCMNVKFVFKDLGLMNNWLDICVGINFIAIVLKEMMEEC